MKYKIIVLAIFFGSINTIANCQKTTLHNFKKEMEQYISRYVVNGDFSGNILVAKGDKVIFNKSYGKANFSLNIPMKEYHKFRIASVSKTFTAAAIVMLCNKGLVSYTDKLSKYIPDFSMADSISVLHLLLHQAGIPEIEYDRFALDKLSLNEIIQTIKDKPLLFKPGSRSSYSNSGYLLLAAIIEKASGLTYEKYLNENIFKPIGMFDTGADFTGKIIPLKVTGHNVGTGARGIAEATWYDINLETGSGSLYSTSQDLLKWLKAIKANTFFDIKSLVYPFGWGKREYFNHKPSIEQSGFLNGYSSYIAVYPSQDLYIIALSNISSNFNEQSGKDLAAIYFKEKYTLPQLRNETIPTNLKQYSGKYSFPGYKDFFIELKSDAIYWRFGDEKNGSPLAPVSDDHFLLRLLNIKIVFLKDQKGEVVALNFISGNDTTTCTKIE